MSRSYQRSESVERNAFMNMALGRRRRMALAVSVATAALAPAAMGSKNVDVERVVAGSAQISTVGNKTIIRAADRTIIDFKSFNVTPQESVQFIQPTSTSRLLDRINSQTPTSIDGSISANGIVYFVNPSGVTFGPHSVVTANQIFTAAGGLSNANFLAGSNNFQVSGKVQNDGSIAASNGVALIGQQLVNNGTITASNGVVVFALGGEVYVGSKDDNIIVKVNPAETAATAKSAQTLQNTGSVTAGDEADMASGDMYATVLNIGGQVTAPKISVASGKQGTTNVTGTLNASNVKGKGGRIEITGNAVTLTGATVNASGSTGGGDVRVGGDFHGKGTLLASHQTLVDAASKISADSTQTGAGGTIAVWSDGNTGVHGSISAAGTTGAGGYIETSGLGILDISHISLSAIGTKAGQWLLDPTDVTINGSPSSNETFDPTTPPGSVESFTPTPTGNVDPDMSYIAASDIVSALSRGASVKIVTSGTGTTSGMKNGDILVDTTGAIAVTYATAILKPTLTLQADNSITIAAPITASGMSGFNVVLNSLKGSQGVTVGTTGATNSISTNGGTFTASATSGDVNIMSGNTGIATGGGVVSITALAGTVTISSPITTGGGNFMSASGNFSLTGSASPGAVIDTSVSGAVGGSVSITVSGFTPGPLNMVTINEPVTTGGGMMTINANQVDVTASGSITTSAPLAPPGTSGGAFVIQVPTGTGYTSGGVAIDGPITTTGGTISIDAATITSTNTIDSSIPSGVPNVQSGGGDITLIGESGPINLTKSVTAGVANLTLQTVTAAGSISASTLQAVDAISSPKSITVSAPLASVSVGTMAADTGKTVGVSITSAGPTTATLPDLMSSFSLVVNPASTLNITGGGLGISNDANGNLILSGTDSIAGAVNITTTAGGITVGMGGLDVNGPMILTANQGIDIANAVQISAATGQNGNLTLQSGSGGMATITVGAAVNANGPLTLISTADIAINNTISINTTPGAGSSGSVSLTAINGVTETGPLGYITGLSPAPLTLSGAGNFALMGNNSVTSITANMLGVGTGSASLEFTNTSTLAVNAVTVVGATGTTGVGNITLTAPELDIDSPINAPGNISLTANVMTISAPVTAATGTINIQPDSNTTPNVYLAETAGANGLTLGHADLNQLTATSVLISSLASGAINVGNGAGLLASGLTSPLTLTSTNIIVDLNGAFETGSSQTYNGPVTIQSAANLWAPVPKSTITFAGTVNGPGENLTAHSSSTLIFEQPVGGIGAGLGSLTAISDLDSIQINSGTVTTTGLQKYTAPNGSVFLNSPVPGLGGSFTTTLSGGGVELDQTVLPSPTAGLQGLVLTAAVGSNIFISGLLGNSVYPLYSVDTSQGAGATTFSGGTSVTTLTSQTYGTTELSGSGLMTTLNAGVDGSGNSVNFTSTVNATGGSAPTLKINATGTVTFANSVGTTLTPLGSLAIDYTAGGSVYIDGGSVITSGAQDYAVPVTLANSAGNTVITGSKITFESTVQGMGAPQTLNVQVSGGGMATFSGAVTLLSKLVTQSAPLNPPSSVEINGGSVTTTSSQEYDNAVTLGYQTQVAGVATTVVSGSSITFGGTLDAETVMSVPPQALVINTDSTSTGVTFKAAVGQASSTSKLQSLTTGGSTSSTNIDGGFITTTGFQYYNNPVFLNSGLLQNTILSGTDIHFYSTLNALTANEALAISSNGGTITFDKTVGGISASTYSLYSLTTSDSSGSGANTVINTAAITTSQGQIFNNALKLETDTALTSKSSSVTLNAVDDYLTPGSAGLTVNSVNQLFNGLIGQTSALSHLTVTGTGTTSIKGGLGTNQITINTTGAQTYGLPVQLKANTTLLSSGGGAIQFISTVDSDTSGNHYALSANTTGSIIFGNSVGLTHNLGSLTINDPTLSAFGGPGGLTVIQGAHIDTTGSQTYNNPVKVEATTALTSNTKGDIKFASTVDADSAASMWGLTVEADQGDVFFEGNVGTVALGQLVVTATTGTIHITGGNVMAPTTITTTGEQYYDGPVDLETNTTLAAGALNLIKFFHGLTGAFSLTTNAGKTEFDGMVSIGSLNVTGNTLIMGGGVTTVGSQIYNELVTLSNTPPASPNTVLIAGGDIFFHATLDTDATSSNPQNLQIMSQGTVTFGGAVGTAPTKLGTLEVSANVNTAIDGGSVNTVGAQTYDQNVTISGSTFINAGGNVTFTGTLQSGALATVASTLTITSPTQIFEKAVGGTGPANMLISLDTTGGSAQIDGGQVTTTSYQFYHDVVTLGGTPGAGGVATTTLTASAFDFASTLSAQSGTTVAPQALVIDLNSTTASHISFGDAVGDFTPPAQLPLYSLLTQDIGTASGNLVKIYAARITTTASQQYGEEVALEKSAVLKAGTGITFAGNIIVGSDATGPADLTVNAGGVATFGGNVGLTPITGPLNSLTVVQNTGASIVFNGNFVHTVGAQSYGNPMSMGNSPVTLNADDSSVSFSNTLTGNVALTINSVGQMFGNAVTNLISLTTNGSNVVANGSAPAQIDGPTITTSSFQLYNDAVRIAGSTAMTAGGNVTFTSTVDDIFSAPGAFSLSVSSPGLITFGDKVGNLSELKNLTIVPMAGTTIVEGTIVKTSGTQDYGQSVLLDATTTSTTTFMAGGNVTFEKTLDSFSNSPAQVLIVSSPTNIDFAGVVGGTHPLQSLSTIGGGTTEIGGGVTSTVPYTISTVDFQSYGGAVVLTNTTNLQAGGFVTFAGAVSGPWGLTTTAVGVTTFDNTVSIASLTVNGTTAIDGGIITTSSGDQLYEQAVTLGDGTSELTTLTANSNVGLANITFVSTLDAQAPGIPAIPVQALDISASGAVTFGDNVGFFNALQSLTVEKTNNGTIAINGEHVHTITFQTYGDPTTMRAGSATLYYPYLDADGGKVQFLNTLTGISAGLTVDSVGQEFDNAVVLSSLTANGSKIVGSASGFTQINGPTINTTLFQTYNDAVKLGGTAALSAGGDITFSSTVDDLSVAGEFGLTVSSPTRITFGDKVGSLLKLADLIILPMGGTTFINGVNGGYIGTSGIQQYGDAVQLGADTTMVAGGEVTFAQTLDDGGIVTGGATLSITSPGQIFDGFVGKAQLGSLTTSGSGVAEINGGGVSTVSYQDYQDAVTLGSSTLPSALANTILKASKVSFDSTLDADQTRGLPVQALEIDTLAGGMVTFNKAVGSDPTPLYSLAITAINPTNVLADVGTTEIAGGSVTTTSFQYYQDFVTINAGLGAQGVANTILKGSAITFKYTLDAINPATNQALEIDSTQSGTTGLSPSVDGTIVSITPGQIIFGGAVGTMPLYSLTTVDDGSPSGQVLIEGGSITTINLQRYNQAVYLTNNTTLASNLGGDIDIVSTIDSFDATPRNLLVTTSGKTTFGGLVGHQNSIGSLTTDAGGTTEIDGGVPGAGQFTITTSSTQTYNDNVFLGAETALSAGDNITFATTVDDLAASGRFGLSITSRNQIFDGPVGLTYHLASLTTTSLTPYSATPLSGLAEIDGGRIWTTGAQAFNDDVTLGFGLTSTQGPVTTTLTGSTITFSRTVSAQGGAPSQALDANTFNMTANTGGTVIFNSAVGSASKIGSDLYSLTTNDYVPTTGTLTNQGLTEINGGAITTTTSQLYDGSVTLGVGTIGTKANTILTGTTVTFESTLSSDGSAMVPQALEVDTQAGGTVIFDGAVSLYSLTTATVSTAAAGQSSTTQINGGSVTTTAFGAYTDSFQVYNDVVTIGQLGTPPIGGALTTSLSGAAIKFALTVDAQKLSEPQALVITTTQTDGTVVGGLTAGQIEFDQAVGAMSGPQQSALFSLTTVDAGTPAQPGSVLINGGTITTNNLQQYGQAVLLGNTAVLTSLASGQISFAKTIDADTNADALTVNTSGVTIFGGVIGRSGQLASLTTDAGGTTQINGGGVASGATINTFNFQTFNDAVTVNASTLLRAETGDVTFASNLDADTSGNTYDLTVTSINQVFKGLVGSVAPLQSITTNTDPDKTMLLANQGTAEIQGGLPAIGATITTTGAQTFNDAVKIYADTILASTNMGNVKFDLTVDSDAAPHALTVNTAGETYFVGAVGGKTQLLSLTTDDLSVVSTERGGTTHIDGGLVNVVNTQSYYDAVALGQNTMMFASGEVNFATILNDEPATGAGSAGLSIRSLGQIFNGTVGSQIQLAYLVTQSTGTGVAAINGGSVLTTQFQLYQNAVTLGQATQLGANGDVTFAMTVQDGSAATLQTMPSSLTIDSLNQQFQGIVGGNSLPLLSLTTYSTGGGSAEIQAGVPGPGLATITTVQGQAFNDATRLYTDATLASTTGGAVLFAQAVDSDAAPHMLTVNTAGTTTFAAPVGANVPLLSLLTDDPAAAVNELGGITQINGGLVSTMGLQTYNDPVTVAATTLLRAGAGDVTFANTLNANATANTFGLTITSVNQVFKGLVGSIAPLQSITTNTDPNGTTLAANIGSAEIQGGLPTVGSATITTTGAQTFNDAVTIYADATLASTNAGAVTFAATVDSDAAFHSLTINTAGTTTFGGAVGSKAALLSLTTDDPAAPINEIGGVTQINGGSVLTTRFQTYNDAVTLGAETTLKAGIDETATQRDVTFIQTVDDAPASAGMFGLTISSLNQIFEGVVGSTSRLLTLTTSSDPNATLQPVDQGTVQIKAGVPLAGAGTVVTQAGQTYTDATVIYTDATLTSTASGAITFAQTVDSDAMPHNLTVNTAGSSTFASAVGSKAPLLNLVTDDVLAPQTELHGTTAINGGSVTTMLLQTYNNAVTLGQDTQTNGTNVSFLGNLDSTYKLTVNADATFGGLVGSVHPLNTITVVGTTSLATGTYQKPGDTVSIVTMANQAYDGAVSLGAAGSLSSVNGNLNFQSTVDGNFDLTVAAASQGNATFSNAVGGGAALQSLTVIGNEIILPAAVTTTAAQTYTAGDEVTSTAKLTGGSVTASGNQLELYGGALTVNNQTYTARSAASDSYLLTGLYKSTNGGVELDATNQGGLTLKGATTFDAANNLTLDVSAVAGKDAKGNALDQDLSLYAGTVTASSYTQKDNTVINLGLPSSAGANDTTSSIGDGSTPPGTITVNARTLTVANFNLGWYDSALSVANVVPASDKTKIAPNTSLHAFTTAISPSSSSVVFRGPGGDSATGSLLITASGDVTMDKYVKMAVVGYTPNGPDNGGLNLILTDKAATATLSDINVQGDLNVRADNVSFVSGSAVNIATLTGTNTTTDPTVDLVATNLLKISYESGDQVNWFHIDSKGNQMSDLSGSIPAVNFGWNFSTSISFAANILDYPGLLPGKAHVAHEFTPNFFVTTYNLTKLNKAESELADPAGDYLATFNAAQQLYGAKSTYFVTPDLKADGLTPDTPNTAQTSAAVIPSLVVSAGLTGAQINELAQMHITARDVSTDEVIDGLNGRRLYAQAPDDPQAQIAVDRLDNEVTQDVLNAYHHLGSGKSVTSPNGQAWQNQMKLAFTEAWKNWHGEKPADFRPDVFRRAMLADPTARQYLLQMQTLLTQLHENMGLTDHEFNLCRDALIGPIIPYRTFNTTQAVFYTAIVPPNSAFISDQQKPNPVDSPTKPPAPAAKSPDDKKPSDTPKPIPVEVPDGQSASIKPDSEVALASR